MKRLHLPIVGNSVGALDGSKAQGN